MTRRALAFRALTALGTFTALGTLTFGLLRQDRRRRTGNENEQGDERN
jgi:hypothetical protein